MADGCHQVRTQSCAANSGDNNTKLDSAQNKNSEELYEEVASLGVEDFKNFLEEVSTRKIKKEKTISQVLLKNERELLKEESGSGEDSVDKGRIKRKKRNLGRYLQSHSNQAGGSSAAARSSTGGSLGSLQDLTDDVKVSTVVVNNPGVSSKSISGSCGNLSRGSFETQLPRKKKSRRSKGESNRASTSQKEGGSLQNLSKPGVTCGEPKKLHKSGSLSQVYSDNVTGARSKNRRQKTPSESSGSRVPRHGEESSDDEAASCLPALRSAPSPHSVMHVADQTFQPEGIGTYGSMLPVQNEDSVSACSSGSEGSDYDRECSKKLGGHMVSTSSCPTYNIFPHSRDSQEGGTEMQTFNVHSQNDSEVDKPIKFALDDNNIRKSSRFSSHGENEGFFLSSRSEGNDKDYEDMEKGTFKSRTQNENNMDINGNPYPSFNRVYQENYAPSAPEVSTRSTPLQLTSLSRKNGYNQHKEIFTNYDKMKARQDKKKANKEKAVISSENTPGFRGQATIEELLQYLGADKEDPKNKKKKNKPKKGRDDKFTNRSQSSSKDEHSKRERSWEDNDDGSWSDVNKETSASGDISDKKLKGKSDKNNPRKLREASSVEDLHSQSKQTGALLKKQMTVDGGTLNRGANITYHRFDSSGNSRVVTPSLHDHSSSEFEKDFYRIGDPFLEGDNSNMSGSGGDFEVVTKRKSKRNKSTGSSQQVSLGTRAGGSAGSAVNSAGWTGPSYEDHRRHVASRYDKPHGGVKPLINFSEGPRTSHDDSFIAHWAQGSSDRGPDRYQTTASAPHSEDSDSDGDSVHSMPANSTTPRPDVRKPPPSTDSTPQASYANIAKLSAATNKGQIKKNGNQPAGAEQVMKKADSAPPDLPDTSERGNESKINSILDENFPSLSESVSVSSSNHANHLLKSNNDSGISCDMSNSFNQSMNSQASDMLKKDENNKDRTLSSCSSEKTDLNDAKVTEHVPSCKSNAPNETKILNHDSPSDQSSSKKSKTLSISSPISHSTPQVNQVLPSIHKNKTETSRPPSFSQNKKPNVGPTTNNSSHSVKNHNSAPHSNSIGHKKSKTSCSDAVNSLENKSINCHETNKKVQRKYEPAVVFTGKECVKFDDTITDIEFGCFDDSDLAISSEDSDAQINLNEKNKYNLSSNGPSLNNCNTSNNNIKTKTKPSNKLDNDNVAVKNKKNANKDFSKMFNPPKSDKISYNHQELVEHFSKLWENTLRLLEEDNEEVEYYSAV